MAAKNKNPPSPTQEQECTLTKVPRTSQSQRSLMYLPDPLQPNSLLASTNPHECNISVLDLPAIISKDDFQASNPLQMQDLNKTNSSYVSEWEILEHPPLSSFERPHPEMNLDEKSKDMPFNPNAKKRPPKAPMKKKKNKISTEKDKEKKIKEERAHEFMCTFKKNPDKDPLKGNYLTVEERKEKIKKVQELSMQTTRKEAIAERTVFYRSFEIKNQEFVADQYTILEEIDDQEYGEIRLDLCYDRSTHIEVAFMTVEGAINSKHHNGELVKALLVPGEKEEDTNSGPNFTFNFSTVDSNHTYFICGYRGATVQKYAKRQNSLQAAFQSRFNVASV